MVILTVQDKLAKAISWHQYPDYASYCQAMEYEQDDKRAIEGWNLCKYFAQLYDCFTIQEMIDLSD